MHPARRSLVWLNAIGGAAVLASYAHGLSSVETRSALWGGVPDALRPLYVLSMGLATAGYFAFSYFVLRCLDPDRALAGPRLGYRAFHVAYALILLPSALWLPLTARMLAEPSEALWLLIRAVLFLVALGSVALLAGIAGARPTSSGAARALAIAGALAFCFQTAVLDAWVWPAYFPGQR